MNDGDVEQERVRWREAGCFNPPGPLCKGGGRKAAREPSPEGAKDVRQAV